MTSCGKSGGWLRHWTCKHFEIWSCWLDENLFKEYFTMTDQTLLGSKSLAGKKIKAKQTNTGVENQTHRLLLTTVLDLVWFALVTAPWLLADAASHCTEARCATPPHPTPPHHRRNANRWWPLLEKMWQLQRNLPLKSVRVYSWEKGGEKPQLQDSQTRTHSQACRVHHATDLSRNPQANAATDSLDRDVPDRIILHCPPTLSILKTHFCHF